MGRQSPSDQACAEKRNTHFLNARAIGRASPSNMVTARFQNGKKRIELFESHSYNIAQSAPGGGDQSQPRKLAMKIDVRRTNEKERKVEPLCAILAHEILQEVENYRFFVQSIIGATEKRAL